MNASIRRLRVVVADDERDTRQFLQEVLTQLGHEVTAVCATGRELIDRCHATRPDIVITDIKMPDMDGIEAAEAIAKEQTVPVILVSAHHEAELLARAGAGYIMAYLVKPVKPPDLQAALTMGLLRFEQFQAVRKEAADLRQALEDRKIIERAKGVLMELGGLSERDAFRRLQKMASDKNRKMLEVAQMILTVEEAFRPAEKEASHR
jgi:AmiR/NasT family two-component response regulator